jgi:hypothetical protein
VLFHGRLLTGHESREPELSGNQATDSILSATLRKV